MNHRDFPRTAAVVLCISLLASSARAGNWIPLFDGQTLNGWTTQNGRPVTQGWRAENGVLHLHNSDGRGGNLLTDHDFGDFELVFEWKISDKGNSGIKYRVKEFGGRILGCEYQMLDDERFPRNRGKQSTASLYDLYEPSADKPVLPSGEFNRGRIVVCGNRIEHWLNRHRVMTALVGSPEWNQRVSESKFSNVSGFGTNRLGKIMLTDHNSEVWFRNVFVRDLSSTSIEYCRTRVSRARRVMRPFRRFVRCR